MRRRRHACTWARSDGAIILERAAVGSSWQTVGHGIAGCHISALLYEPRRGDVFAGSHAGGLYASADGGQTWERKNGGAAARPDLDPGRHRAGRDRCAFAGSEPAHLYRSLDYGETWEEVAGILAVQGREQWMFPPPPHLAHVKNLAFDPSDPDVIYVGIEQGALLKSEDSGRTWCELDAYFSADDLFYKDVHRLEIAPTDPRRLYMATGDGFYASEDRGRRGSI